MVKVNVKMGLRGLPRGHRLAILKSQRKPGIRVEPRDEEMRVLMKHPRGGGFRSVGSVEWPDDRFTRRRLQEGVIKLAAPRNGSEEQSGHERRVERRQERRAETSTE
jgi:hypothetical protein